MDDRLIVNPLLIVGGPFDEFGLPLAISGETVVVGAQRHDEFDPQSGAAYVYRFDGSTWHQEQELLPGDGYQFGWSAALTRDVAMFGEGHLTFGSVAVFRGLSDCNDNGTLDLCDIADGTSQNTNANGIPDEWECPWDLDGNGGVGVSDLLALLASWGPCKGCPADFDENGNVGVSNLLALLASWGPRP